MLVIRVGQLREKGVGRRTKSDGIGSYMQYTRHVCN